jgi:Ni/Co efflux regulator RcnB
MHRIVAAAAIAALTFAASTASARPHPEWHSGAHMNRGDWSHGQAVDYHQHHLRAPPRGYAWREVDGNYVLAAVTTGLILSVIAANH